MLAAAAGVSSNSRNVSRQSVAELLGQHRGARWRPAAAALPPAAWSAPRGRARRSPRAAAASKTDSAWPNFIAPPLSCPSTEKICSAVRCCISRATISAGRPPMPLAETERGPAGDAQRQRGQLGGAGHRPARDVRHRLHCSSSIASSRPGSRLGSAARCPDARGKAAGSTCVAKCSAGPLPTRGPAPQAGAGPGAPANPAPAAPAPVSRRALRARRHRGRPAPESRRCPAGGRDQRCLHGSGALVSAGGQLRGERGPGGVAIAAGAGRRSPGSWMRRGPRAARRRRAVAHGDRQECWRRAAADRRGRARPGPSAQDDQVGRAGRRSGGCRPRARRAGRRRLPRWRTGGARPPGAGRPPRRRRASATPDRVAHARAALRTPRAGRRHRADATASAHLHLAAGAAASTVPGVGSRVSDSAARSGRSRRRARPESCSGSARAAHRRRSHRSRSARRPAR